MLLVGASVTWDSNPQRLSSSEDPQAALGTPEKSDRITAAYVALRFDRSQAQQRLLLEVSKSAVRYDNLSYLDFEPLSYSAAWVWSLGPRLGGTLAATRTEAQVNYADFNNVSQRNVRTSENYGLSVDADLSGGWHLVGAATQEKQKNEVTFVEQGSYEANGGSAGVKYVTAAGNSLTAQVRGLDGQYLGQALQPVALLDTGFRRLERELLAAWKFAPKSSLGARLAQIDYRSDNFRERDFSGTAARAAVAWTPTAKLSLNLAAGRDVGPWEADYASYRVDEGLSVAPAWQIGARTVVRASFERIESDHRNPIPAYSGEPRDDSLRRVLLAVDWQPRRGLSVNASLQRERRTSSRPLEDYERRIATLGASLTF